MIESFFQVIVLLSPPERKKLWILMVLLFFASAFEVVGIASVFPLITVISDSSFVFSNPLLRALFVSMDFESAERFMVFLGFCVFLLLLLTLVIRALSVFSIIKFALGREYTIAKRMLGLHLSQSMEWRTKANSAELTSNILSEVNHYIILGLMPFMQLFANLSLCLTLTVFLMIVNLQVSLFAAGFLFLSYTCIFLSIRKFLGVLGEQRRTANESRFRVVSEAFGAYREIKVLGLRTLFIEKFSESAAEYAKTQTISQTFGYMPRFLMEGLCIGALLFMVFYLIESKGTITEALPMLGLYAFAAVRLIPAFQQTYLAATQLRSAKAGINNLIKHSDLPDGPVDRVFGAGLHKAREIKLDKVSFKYGNADRFALKDITIKISEGQRVGIVGKTGCGKSTLIDILLGLHSPTEGKLILEGVENRADILTIYDTNLAFAPQKTFIADNTIMGNICFGMNADQVDKDRAKWAGEVALVEPFASKLNLGYETLIGEDGAQLSGGQRQRIGLARAIYLKPDILVLDEATSALDRATEQIVLENISKNLPETTLILVTHRVDTLRNFDTICVLDKGTLKAQGSFRDLQKSDKLFQQLLR